MSLPFKVVALFLTLIPGLFFAPSAVAQTKPNIVFILVDDLDVEVWKTALALKRDGQPTINLLPNIQRELIDKGTTFEQTFVTQSLCGPSRATFLTGQYPHNHGLTGNHDLYEGPTGFKVNKEPYAIATWLYGKKPENYRTGLIGKYLNDSGEAPEPGQPRHVPAGWEDWRALIFNSDETKKSSPLCMYGFTMADGKDGEKFEGNPSNPFDPDTYQTDVFTKYAVDFIKKPDRTNRPFFLVVTPTAPHVEGCRGPYRDPEQVKNAPGDPTPPRVRTAKRYLVDDGSIPYVPTPHITLPAINLASYDELDLSDKPTWMRGETRTGKRVTERRETLFNDKVAALRPVDDMVGAIINALQAVGKLDNTLIVFASDNGYQYGTHHLFGKQDLYEESIRVPMVVRAPGPIRKNTSQAWVLNNDWAPTIADYAQANPTMKVDGRSFKPLLDAPSGEAAPRQTFLFSLGDKPVSGAKKSGKFTAADDDGVGHIPFLMVRTKHPALTGDPSDETTFVYAETYNPSPTLPGDPPAVEYELYDLKTDQIQNTSRHEDSTLSGRMAKLKAKLDALENCNSNTPPKPPLNPCQPLEDNGEAPFLRAARR